MLSQFRRLNSLTDQIQTQNIAGAMEKTSMTSGDLDLGDMVTKKNLYNPGCVLDICAKNEVDPTIGLGGVREHTDTKRTNGYYSIDAYIFSVMSLIF